MLNSPYICNIYLNQSFNIFLNWICLVFFKGIFKSHISYCGVAQKERDSPLEFEEEMAFEIDIEGRVEFSELDLSLLSQWREQYEQRQGDWKVQEKQKVFHFTRSMGYMFLSGNQGQNPCL